MPQNIKIGVEGDASGVKKIDDAVGDLAQTLARADKQADKAAGSIRKMEDMARRLKSTQDILSRELKRPVSEADAAKFNDNFERARKRSSSLRGFDDAESWYNGHERMFNSRGRAGAHRRRVLAYGLQGTEQTGPPSDNDNDGFGGAGGGRTGGPPNRGFQRAQSAGMGFVKGSLALAGIGSVMSMASSGISMASDEATGADALKRQMGDLGVDFTRLREQTRSATVGMGMTFVESARLAQQFSRVAGNLSAGDMAGGGVGRSLRTAYGFSRSLGIEPEAGVQFFGNMRRMGVGTDDQGQRKLALTIADAIAKGGYGGKADEVLAAIADFGTKAAALTLTSPNVAGFAGGMGSLMSMGYAGMDPAAAAAILGSADSAARRGGAFGQASMNFSFAALSRGLPGINPVTAQGLMSGGIFGSTQQMFGKGSPLGDWYRENGVKTPALSGTTNLQRMLPMLRQQYGKSPFYLEALKNHFGLQSTSQAAVLDRMKDGGGALGGLVARSGLNIADIKDTSYAALGRIANTRSRSGLGEIASSVLGRQDISAAERASIKTALDKGSIDELQQALVKVVGTHEQVETEGTRTRSTISELKNEVTKAGGALLDPINKIREAIVAIASTIAPGAYEQRTFGGDAADVGADFVKPYSVKHVKNLGLGMALNRRYDDIYKEAGEKYGISADELELRAQTESGQRNIAGPKTKYGQAFGLMQVTPATAATWGHKGADLNDPRTNIMIGSKIWAGLVKKHKGDRYMAAQEYYGGAGRDHWGKNTRQYALNAVSAYGGVLSMDRFGRPLGTASTPIPEAAAAAERETAAVRHQVEMTGETKVVVTDHNGRPKAETVLRPVVKPKPAGT